MSDEEEPLRCRLRDNWDYLIGELRVSLYINILFEKKVLAIEDREQLLEIPVRGLQAEKFVDIMLHKSESSIQKFLDILKNHEDKQPQIYKRLFRDSKQEHQSQRARREHEVAANLEDPEWDSLVTPRLPDVVKALRPTLLLDDLRAARILSRAEYSELLQVSTEEMRSRMLLNDLLPRQNGSFSNFCKILLKVEGQEHIVTEILKIGVSQTISAAKGKEDKDLPMVTRENQTHANNTSASSASYHQSAVQQPSFMQRKEDLECNSEQNASYNFTERGKQKQDVMDGSFARRSKKEHVEQHCSPVRSQKQSSDKVTTTTEIQGSPGIMFFFKTEHFDHIEKFKTTLTSTCAKCYGILEKKVMLLRSDIAEMEYMVESWKNDDAYRVHMDCESILAVIRVSGGDKEDMLDSDKKRMLEEFIVDLLKKHDPLLKMGDCKIVEVIRCSLFIVFKLSIKLGIHLLCTLSDSLKSLRDLLQELFPRSTSAVLRLGGLPSLPLFSTQGDSHVQKGESRESVLDDKNEVSEASRVWKSRKLYHDLELTKVAVRRGKSNLDTSLSERERRLIEDAADKEAKAVFDFYQSKAMDKFVSASEKRTERLNVMSSNPQANDNSLKGSLTPEKSLPAKRPRSNFADSTITMKPSRQAMKLEHLPKFNVSTVASDDNKRQGMVEQTSFERTKWPENARCVKRPNTDQSDGSASTSNSS